MYNVWHESGLVFEQVPEQHSGSVSCRTAYKDGALDSLLGRRPKDARNFVEAHGVLRFKAYEAGYAHGQRLGHRAESGEQCALIEWAIVASGEYPALRLLHSTPNGGERPKAVGRRGQTYSLEGQKLKAEGARDGFPDLTLEYPSGQFHRLHLEMKRPGGKPSESQIAWLAALESVGDMCVICYSFDQARASILDYLRQGDGQNGHGI